MTRHRHRHRMVWTAFFCYAGPIAGAEPNPAAHGGITETQRCACGAVRQLNVNGRHVEAGPWVEPGELREGEP